MVFFLINDSLTEYYGSRFYMSCFTCTMEYYSAKSRGRQNGERKGTRAVLLGVIAAFLGLGYSTTGPRTSRQFFFWAAVY